MLDSKSSNTSLLEGIICCKNQGVFIRDLSYVTLQIIFDALWASMHEGLKRHIAWNNPRHALSWPFYLHCGIEATGSLPIICNVCHHALCDPSEHGTSSMGKHLHSNAYIAKLDELTEIAVTELTSAMVNDTAFAILKRQGSRGITIASLQRKISFDVQFDPY
jgi:hypothetical protein